MMFEITKQKSEKRCVFKDKNKFAFPTIQTQCKTISLKSESSPFKTYANGYPLTSLLTGCTYFSPPELSAIR